MSSLKQITRKSTDAWRLSCSLAENVTAAEDILQEAWLVAIRREQDIPAGKEWPWFTGVIINKARESRRGHRMTQLSDELPSETVQGVDEETLSELRLALTELDAELCEAVSLTQLAGLTVREAAEVLSVARSTVQDRVDRGLERLRSRMKKHRDAVAMLAFLPFPTTRRSTRIMKTGGQLPVWAGIVLLLALGLAAVAYLTWDPGSESGGVQEVASRPPNEVLPPSSNASVEDHPETPAAGSNGPEASQTEGGDEAQPGTAMLKISGRFVSEEGLPIVGASIWARSSWWDRPANIGGGGLRHGGRKIEMPKSPPNFRSEGTTDDDGRFTLKDIPDGSEVVIFGSHPDYFCQRLSSRTSKEPASAFDLAPAVPTPRPGETIMRYEVYGGGSATITAAEGMKVQLKATPAAWISGRVLDPSGAPIQGALLTSKSYSWGKTNLYAASDSKGEYRLGNWGEEEELTLSVSAPGYMSRKLKFSPRIGGASLDLTLKHAGLVYGSFTQKDPASAMDFKVTVICPGERHSVVVHGDSSEFRIDTLVVGRSYQVQIWSAPKFNFPSILAESEWFIAGTRGIEIHLKEESVAECEVSIPDAAFLDEDSAVVCGIWERDRRPSLYESLKEYKKLGTVRRGKSSFTAKLKRDGIVTIIVLPSSNYDVITFRKPKFDEFDLDALWVSERCLVCTGQVTYAHPVQFEAAWLDGSLEKEMPLFPVYDEELVVSSDQRVSTVLPAGNIGNAGPFWPGRYLIKGREVSLVPGRNRIEEQ